VDISGPFMDVHGARPGYIVIFRLIGLEDQ